MRRNIEPVSIEITEIMLERFICKCVEINGKKNWSLYRSEYNCMYHFLCRYTDYVVLLIDEIDITKDRNLMALDTMSRLLEKNLCILTFLLKK